ncbi:MAG: hypothetical protein ACI80V_000301 [Rhodothermales bacterium]|jgi:hypothetical protein
MPDKSLYDTATMDAVLARIDALTQATRPQWGKMDVAQMLGHCAEILEVANGKPLTGTPLIARLFKGMIRKMVVGPKPYAKSITTHPQYVMADTCEFQGEKTRLKAALSQISNEGPEGASRTEHALFGRMTAQEKGWGMYKHLDHHFTQFGV